MLVLVQRSCQTLRRQKERVGKGTFAQNCCTTILHDRVDQKERKAVADSGSKVLLECTRLDFKIFIDF